MNITGSLQVALRHHEAGRLQQAEEIYRRILAIQPDHVDALHLLGLVAQQTGHHEAAATLLQRATAAKPNDAELHAALGASLGIAGRRSEAIAALERAIQLRPDLADAHNNLGNVCRDDGQIDTAVASFDRAIALRPGFYEAHFNRGQTLLRAGRAGDAVEDFRIAAQLRPQDAQAYYQLGLTLEHTNRREEALPHYQEAAQLDPNFAEAHFNAGACLSMGVDVPAALECFCAAAQIRPMPAAGDMILHFQHHLPDADSRDVFEQHVRWAKEFADPLAASIEPHRNDRDPGRRLRIGYVSPDFRRHSVAHFIEPLLEAHDRREVEIYCYANEIRSDAVTQRIRALAGCWRNITGVADADVARMVRDDAIDILVDLAGHSQNNRLLVFAHKPAPVQVTYLGYPDTTGMRAIDYRLTDALTDPPGMTDALYTEQLVRLPGCAWCYRPPDDAPPVQEGRPSDSVTFGSFSVASKINPPLIALWAQILRAVPRSRILIKTGHSIAKLAHAAIYEQFAAHGIGSDRIEMVGLVADVADHLRAYSRADIALDTFPYNGTTTTCEALWMGMPVVSLAGKTHASRVGLSLLNAVGLAELAANDRESYVAIAIGLARDQERLTQFRRELRRRMQSSPLMDAIRFARKVENAYRGVWRSYASL